MTIEKNIREDLIELKLSGWLDTRTSKQLHEEIEALDAAIVRAVLDLSALEYISSAGVREIVTLHKRMKPLELVHVPDNILEVLAMTGLHKRLNISP